METKHYIVDAAQSRIEWEGRKINGAHHGLIGVSYGRITLSDGALKEGTFTIDMSSITVLDFPDRDANAQLTGHLNSEDFFGVDRFPFSTLDFFDAAHVKNDQYRVSGNLTIKGILHPIAFDAKVVLEKGGTLQAVARLVVDRTRFGMKFRSGSHSGDNPVADEFCLNVLLTAKAI